MSTSTNSDCICHQPPPAPPVFIPTVEAMAEAMRSHHQDCTEDLLQGLGFPLAFQHAHRDAAVALANAGFVRQAERVPTRNLTDAEREATAIIGELMPPTRLIIAELQARGFSKTEIDIVLRPARAMAAIEFARGEAH